MEKNNKCVCVCMHDGPTYMPPRLNSDVQISNMCLLVSQEP